MTFRDTIVAEALRWQDTPYHRLAILPGIGADCAGILYCLYRDTVGSVAGWPEYHRLPAPYENLVSQTWHCHTKQELLLGLLQATMPRLIEIPLPQALPGDILLTGSPGEPSNHVAFVLPGDLILHARIDPRAKVYPAGRIMVERRHPAFRKTERTAFLLLAPEEPDHA